MPLKICMIGCGSFAALAHGPAQRLYAASGGDLCLSACCDVDAERSRAYAQKFGFARSYTDLSRMLAAEKPDAVVAAVPPHLASGVGLSILEHGIPLLLEKPPGLSLIELNRLRDAARKAQVNVQVAFNRRHMPVMRRAAAVLDRDRGPAGPVRIEYDMVRNERWDADFSTTAIHALDGALCLAGSPFRTASIRYTAHRRGIQEAFDVALDAECESGLQVAITILPVSGRNLEAARVHGIGQCLSLRLPFASDGPSEGRLEHWRRGELIETFTDSDLDFCERIGVYGETSAFFDAIRHGRAATPGLDDCLQQVALMQALRERRAGGIDLEAAGHSNLKPAAETPRPRPAEEGRDITAPS